MIADCEFRITDCASRQSLPLINHAQASRRAQFAGDPVFAALIVPGRAETASQGLPQFYAFQKAVKRQIEIEPRLLAVCDHVQSGGDLIVDRRGVFLQLGAVGLAELVEAKACEFQPAGKGIAANDCCS